MKYLDLTLATPQHNLACDEALLDYCEAGNEVEILRFWEPVEPFVVLGYTNKNSTEVNVPACEAQHIPILRRTSGGGTVLQGPGCLNYSLILRANGQSPLNGISETNSFIMERQRHALSNILNAPVEIQGITDLAITGRKFSGNAQRRKRHYLLFHGTFLLHFDIPLIELVLQPPSKQPAYRQARSHTDFLTNIEASSKTIKGSLKKIWGAAELFESVPFQTIEQLVRDKYLNESWTFKF